MYQLLGFKEFHEYLILKEEDRMSESGQKLLAECIVNMKMATRRYARRQNKMVMSRFLEHPNRDVRMIKYVKNPEINLKQVTQGKTINRLQFDFFWNLDFI